MSTLHLARLTVHARTRNGRPEVTLPSGAVVRLTVRQLCLLLQEARIIRDFEAADRL